MPIAEIARFLQDNLGQRLTARIAHISDPKQVGRWASGTSPRVRIPRTDSEPPFRSSSSSRTPRACTRPAPG
ncbi:hypothetical protein NKH77_32555 [Streptomyces sp. M19]